MKILIPIIILTALSACGTKKNNPPQEPEKKDSVKTEVKVEVTVQDPPPVDTVHKISLENLTISMNEDNFYEDENFKVKPDDDTVQTVQELGGYSEGAWIKVESTQLTNITVEQRFETSVSLSFEGPHCDMVEWKHYLSPWKKMRLTEGLYHIDSIPEKEKSRFPKYTESEFKTAIIKYCGKEALDDFEGKLDVHTYPAWVGISRIYLRISGKNKENNETESIIMVIWVPMGC